jgi:hypothetical protein
VAVPTMSSSNSQQRPQHDDDHQHSHHQQDQPGQRHRRTVACSMPRRRRRLFDPCGVRFPFAPVEMDDFPQPIPFDEHGCDLIGGVWVPAGWRLLEEAMMATQR